MQTLSQGKPIAVGSIRSEAANAMKLSQEDRAALVPSGSANLCQPHHLGLDISEKAGLVSPQRGEYVITDLGLTAYKEVGDRISLRYLEKISPDFVGFRYGSHDSAAGKTQGDQTASAEDDTPEDVMEEAYQKINAQLSDELLSAIMEQSPRFFERLVVQLLLKMGYGGAFDDAAKVTGKSQR